ncbi:cytochrome P450 736A117-like [Argentina anserina]|uniref:cytochrome P450 736A117-like n=1 Tax=Argentina anserina TaxID=57926 RepID=UPI0021765DC2|nr:cytochrome P450 736A117-like [Potentilla anserina]
MLNLLPLLLARLLQPFSLKLILLVIFLVILYKLSTTTTNPSSVPPSPPKLPVIGNLHQLGLYPHRSLQALAQRYGPLMLLHFGSKPVLVVSSSEAAREILKNHDLVFSDRPKFVFFKKMFYNCKDIVTSPYGEYWRQMRSTCVLNLLSNKRVRSFRAVREEEISLLISKIKQSCNSSSSSAESPAVNLSEMLSTLTSDVICRVAMGRKYSDSGEGRGRMFMELSTEINELFARVNIGDYIPWLSWVSRINGLDAELDSLAKRFDEFLDLVVQDHIDSSNKTGGDHLADKVHQDFVDVLLSVQKENSTGFALERVGIKAIILDMFVAGSDTTFTVLEWAMSELLKHPQNMKKLQNEVRKIVGDKAYVTEDDLVSMHYLRAVIKETLRLHPPVPLLLPRMATQDVKVNGYNIKANTQVLVNAWQIGRDPKSYNKPEKYEPERFLNSEIDFKGTDFELIPFGAGRRGCPGIPFGMIVIEIALASLVHNFTWSLPGDEKLENLDMTEFTGAVVHRKYPLIAVAIPHSC